MSSFTIAIVVSVVMGIIMIGLSLAYLKGGYSYKHTVDELPHQEKND